MTLQEVKCVAACAEYRVFMAWNIHRACMRRRCQRAQKAYTSMIENTITPTLLCCLISHILILTSPHQHFPPPPTSTPPALDIQHSVHLYSPALPCPHCLIFFVASLRSLKYGCFIACSALMRFAGSNWSIFPSRSMPAVSSFLTIFFSGWVG